MRHRRTLLMTVAALAAAPLLAPALGQVTVAAGQRRESSSRATADPAPHWPRFRGPNSNPISHHPNLPVSWSKTENVEWAADVPGVGWSSPVVWGNRVFITSATSDQPMKPPSLGVDFSNEYLAELRKQGFSTEEANKKLYERDREMPHEIVISLMLYCYDLESGKKLWERQLYKGQPAGGRHSKNSYASETPTTDGERVYVYLTDYGLFAYDFDGKQSWTTPLQSHATTRDWGTGASAALYKDRLFVLNDNEEQSFVAAFDTRTGKELWRTARTVQPARKTGWSTPFVWDNRARTELVTLGPGVAISYSLDGSELWRMNRMGGYAIQSPFAWNDLVFITSGSGADDNKPIVAVRAGASGNITLPDAETRSEHVAWYDRRAGGTYLPTPVIYQNALYVLTDKGILARYDAVTGERIYQSRVAPGPATFTASPWAYNDHVFAISEEGDTYVIDAADQYRLVRVNSLDDFSMASPAIVGDRLLIRTQHRLYSIRNQATSPPATAATAQAPTIVQPGAPGQASTVVAKVPEFRDNHYIDADVKFMQGMIHHHSQALQMVAMIATHTKTPELIAMGQKIQLSQSGEIDAMKEWLTARKQAVPMMNADGTVMDHGDMPPMPGMLTAEQMKALEAARGAAFDELFLTGMIQHHKGALKMVADLREAGGGKELNIGDFLNEVDNDQRMEIVRMYGLLGRPVEWK